MAKTITEELLAIKKLNAGLLDPVKVVDYARNPNTALHDRFEWNDSKAAEEYRIWQARKIISLELIVIKGDNKERVIRAFVSLNDDRRNDGSRGYRGVMEVMSDDVLRGQLLEQAKDDMNLFKRKYYALKALEKVFEEMDNVIATS